jgi:hypothetical protein
MREATEEKSTWQAEGWSPESRPVKVGKEGEGSHGIKGLWYQGKLCGFLLQVGLTLPR